MRRTFLLATLLLGGCADMSFGDFCRGVGDTPRVDQPQANTYIEPWPCQQCKGTGVIQSGSVTLFCQFCDGTGKRQH